MFVTDGWGESPLRCRLREMLCGVWSSLQWNQTACVGADAGVVIEEAVLRLL